MLLWRVSGGQGGMWWGADDSGSMVFEERGERIDDLKLILGRVAEVATLFDDDGILVRFMNRCLYPSSISSSTSSPFRIEMEIGKKFNCSRLRSIG